MRRRLRRRHLRIESDVNRRIVFIAVSVTLAASAAVVAAPARATSPPVVTSVPASEPSGGAVGVVGGGAMANATAVLVGGVAAPILSDSDSSIKIRFPAHD